MTQRRGAAAWAAEREGRDEGRERKREREGGGRGCGQGEALRVGEGGALCLQKGGGSGTSQHQQSETTVSPQHPCEVGWKVAAIVMPTSQTRPGHGGGRRSRGGQAQAEREGRALGRLPASLPEPQPARAGPPAAHTVTWTRRERSWV